MSQPSPQQVRRRHYLYETGRAEKEPLLPRHLPIRKTVRELLNSPRPSHEILLEGAEQDGYKLGFQDIHTTRANYRSGEEWIAWYRGWKRGQQERPK